MIENRIKYIDTAKAFGIILMILGHCQYVGDIPYLGCFIYTFHMPLFFIISGMFVKPMNLKYGLLKYSKAYIRPYIITCMMMLVLTLYLYLSNSGDGNVIINSLKIYAFGSGSNEGNALFHDFPKVGMIWFLLALFWGCLIYSKIKNCANNWNEKLLAAFFLFFIGYISAKYVRLPLSIQPGLCAVFFIFVGDVINNKLNIDTLSQINKYYIFIFVLLWLITAKLGALNMASCNYDIGIIQIPISIFAVLLFLYFCKQFKINLNWLGKNTLGILVGHQLYNSFCLQTGFNLCGLKTFLPPPVTLVTELLLQVFVAVTLCVLLKKVRIIA